MKDAVWILAHYDYDGCDIFGVFASEAEAQAVRASMYDARWLDISAYVVGDKDYANRRNQRHEEWKLHRDKGTNRAKVIFPRIQMEYTIDDETGKPHINIDNTEEHFGIIGGSDV